MEYIYPAVIRQCKDKKHGTYYEVTFPDFAGDLTDGDTFEEAVHMGMECLHAIIQGEVTLGRELPRPSLDYESNKGRTVLMCVDVDLSESTYTVKQAAAIMGVSQPRVRQMIAAGQLIAEKRNGVHHIYLWSIHERMKAPKQVGRPRKAAAV